jgi:hypothetical protein
MDYLSELQKIEKVTQERKIQKAKLEQSIATAEAEQTKIIEELKSLGIAPENLQSTIDNLQKDIENEIDECNEILK